MSTLWVDDARTVLVCDYEHKMTVATREDSSAIWGPPVTVQKETSDVSTASTAREASDYFNSLPQEDRAKLAPLLEDYRRMGMEEYARKVRGVAREMDMRMRSIQRAGVS